MKAQELDCYGKSLLELMDGVPQEIWEEYSQASSRILAKHLGKGKWDSFAQSFSLEKVRIRAIAVPEDLADRLGNPAFIEQQAEWAATFSALRSLLGKEQALRAMEEISAETFPKMLFAVFPAYKDLKRASDSFSVFREWFLAMMDASREVGVLIHEVKENSRDAFQVNCVRCAWFETHTALGVPDACIPICRSDDIFFPDYCSRIGIRFQRRSTLAQGAAYCDYRFERGPTTRRG